MSSIEKYPDGSKYVVVTTDEPVTWRINDYSRLWLLNQYVDAYYYKYKKNATVFIPCLLDAQADRRFNEGESSGLKLVCSFLNSMKADFTIYHPHNPEVVEALMDHVTILSNKYFVSHIVDKYFRGQPIALMSPDAGGYKSLMKTCEEINWEGITYTATKSRSEEGITMTVDRKDYKGQDILIIDDICVYGGTAKKLSTMLRSKNCGKLFLAVSHITVCNLGVSPLTDHFDKVFVTDSKGLAYFRSDLISERNNIVPENLVQLQLSNSGEIIES